MENSTYVVENHNRYPSLQFIKNKTGEDLTVLVGTELRAKAEIRAIADEVKRYLYKNKLRDTYNYFEYLIAFNNEYINEWNKIIANVIYAEYNQDNTRLEAIEDNIKGSNLFSIERFYNAKYEYRVGY